jgi:Holliday junction resolvase Gen1 C-terminal domain
MRGNGEINLPRIAGLCEEKFTEWGHRTAILGRFRTVLWEATVMRILRRAALEADEKEKEKRLNAGREDWSIIGPLRPSRAEAVGTPASLVKKCLNMSDEDRRRAAFANSGPNVPGHENDPNPLIVKIVSSRQHVSTDKLLEYRVEICPIQLVAITRSGIKGTHPEPANGAALLDDEFAELMDESQRKAKKKPPPDPNTVMRIWLPASIMRHVHPELVDDFEAAEQAKQNKKTTGKGKGKEKTREVDDSSDIELSSSPVETHPKARRPSTKKGQKNASASHMAQDLYQTGSSVIVLDPWFTADQHSSNPSCSLSGDALSAYFLCSQNPDPSSAPDSGDNIPSDDEDLPADEEKPRDRFDILFDQVMGISESSRPRKTNVQRKRPMGTSVDDVEGNRHEESSTPRPTRPIKKKKTIHASVSDQASSTKQNRPRPHFREAVGTDLDFLELSDSEDLLSPFSTVSRKSSAKVSANPHSRSAKSVTSSQVRSTSRHYYPEPSSSQDSRLVLDDADVIIDLT